MVDYAKAIQRPFSDWKKYLIGCALYVIPFLNIITGIFASGYSVMCAKSAMKKDFKLPEWDDWGGMFVKGLLLMVIGIIYMLPAMIVGAIAGFTAAAAIFSGENWMTALGAVGALGGVAFLIILVTAYFLPAATMLFADKGNLGAAFEFGNVFKMALTGTYFVAWLITLLILIGVGIVVGFVSALLAVTVVLPWAISAMFSMFSTIMAMSVFGQVYAEVKR
ncbi:DUF4013 domain-containing protein [Candidatus Woesearchaeota archaeon]|nr:DUF4013 domain-containing protein [Candidatus Woesearchaeota archaeon]